jgi:hypothetical protein
MKISEAVQNIGWNPFMDDSYTIQITFDELVGAIIGHSEEEAIEIAIVARPLEWRVKTPVMLVWR